MPASLARTMTQPAIAEEHPLLIYSSGQQLGTLQIVRDQKVCLRESLKT